MPQIDIDPATGAPIIKPATTDFVAPPVTNEESNTSEVPSTESKTEAASVTVGDVTSTEEVKSEDKESTDRPSAGTTESAAPVVESLPEVKTEEVKEPSEKEKRVKFLHEECARIESEAGGFGNIGMTSPYWDMRKELQGLK